MFIQSTMNVKH